MKNYLKKFRNKKILVIGDIMLDRYISGDVDRISPEAPVPIVDVKEKTKTLGGAANVAHNLFTLGASPILCGVVGADIIGGEILRELDELNVEIGSIIIDPNRPTTIKTRVVGNNRQIVRFDEESRERIEDEDIERIVKFVKNNLKNVDGIIISDYNKGVISPQLMAKIFDLSNFSTFVISDPHKDNFESHKHVNLVTPNKEGVDAFCGFNIKNENDLEFAAKKILHDLACGSILITEGKEGMTLFEGNNEMIHIPTVAKEIFDVSGAGDCVVAMISLGIASGMDLEAAVRLANFAAGIVVGKMGTATIKIEELREVVNGNT
jgi:D-beta-D-heptose 7-phosphate kinase/D-beta-D-heptose 1-phosphate adenosyltransferase